MDALYLVRPGTRNEELRYSLRSLANLPHDKVLMAGFIPPWVRNVIEIPLEQKSNKQANTRANLVVALRDTRLSRYFLMMNDDMYVMHPLEYMPALHGRTVAHMLKGLRHLELRGYRRAMHQTAQILIGLGIENPLSYELHVPMRFEKHLLLRLITEYGHIEGLHYRTLYGNLHQKRSRYMEDVKVYGAKDGTSMESWPFLSTADNMHHPVGAYIRERFPEPSPYERV